MKKTIYVILGLIMVVATACYDDYKDNFDTSSVYFPFERPVRTVVLPDSTIEIGVVLGGKRDSDVNEFAYISLIKDQIPDGGELLPDTHYRMNLPSDSLIEIKAGDFNGVFEVTFTQAFFDDPKSTGNNYVIPLEIVQYTTDTLLVDQSKTFVMVKYINEYHGDYFQLGFEDTIAYAYNEGRGNVLSDSLGLFTQFKVSTVSVDSISVPNVGEGLKIPGETLVLAIADDGSVTGDLIVEKPGVLEIKDLTGKVHDNKSIVYEYTYSSNGGADVPVKDSLVYLQNGLSFEEWGE
ncbi:DUF1735 domain-containing protein [Reichenbachiella versicolor]|uniref:DUF1735 domain-containing protein n=1 Tax=Reichenbachiella versicolor TaxID=1821036 RepID=UPI000D6E4711|nr:DUF1735 domain-containing protein [Reichenbachiella versicolor]